MAAVVVTVDAEAATGQPLLSNEEIAEAAAAHPDVLIPFGSIDPARGMAGVRAARRLAEHGVRGFKFHPSLQAFKPNHRRVYPLYQELQSLDVPALFHTGRRALGPVCRADAGSSCATPTRCCSTTSPLTSRA
jgi:predicted TIM-barrel fold metal-dependent hydrolase